MFTANVITYFRQEQNEWRVREHQRGILEMEEEDGFKGRVILKRGKRKKINEDISIK